ncbi:MAG: hypothetical protein R2830_17910 [Saprospiraceae bacterium]
MREVKENEVLPLDTLLLNAIEDVERRFWQTLVRSYTGTCATRRISCFITDSYRTTGVSSP